MYTLEERMKAVQLYIEYGNSENGVIRTLGYPSLICRGVDIKSIVPTVNFMYSARQSHVTLKYCKRRRTHIWKGEHWRKQLNC